MNLNEQNETRLRHLNLVLQTIRNINHLITKETNRSQLIRDLCDTIYKGRGYHNIWIVLLDGSQQVYDFAEAGLRLKFQRLIDFLKSGHITRCAHLALTQSDPVIIKNPAEYCIDCPLSTDYEERGAITARLAFEGKVFGLVCASLPVDLISDEEEISIFKELKDDISLALNNIEVSELQEQTSVELQIMENRYRVLFEEANDAIYVRNLDGNILIANQSTAQLTGYPVEQLIGMNISTFLSRSSFQDTMTKQNALLHSIDKKQPQRYELEMIRRDGGKRIIEVVTSVINDSEESYVIQAIARDITQQKRELKNAEIYSDQIIKAQEEERERVALELHDDTAQALASLGIEIGSIINTYEKLDPSAAKHLRVLQDRTNDILIGVRNISKALRPPMLEEIGLVTSLQILFDNLQHQNEVRTDYKLKGKIRRLPADIELSVFRIIQETLSNIIKHAQAKKVSLEVEFSEDVVKFSVTDDGQGFIVPGHYNEFVYSGCLGIAGMLERSKLVHGKLIIESQPGEGTKVLLEIPIQ